MKKYHLLHTETDKHLFTFYAKNYLEAYKKIIQLFKPIFSLNHLL